MTTYPKPKDAPKPGSLRYDVIDGAYRQYRGTGRQVCLDTPQGRNEYRRRTVDMAERQKWICLVCELPMAKVTTDFRFPTFDHEAGRGAGGAIRDDRITDADGRPMNGAVHFWCNAKKGSRRFYDGGA